MTFYAAVFDGKRKAYRVKKMNLHTRNGEALYPGPIVLWPRLFGRLKDCLDWINERQPALFTIFFKPSAIVCVESQGIKGFPGSQKSRRETTCG